jgi:hypothetical protein
MHDINNLLRRQHGIVTRRQALSYLSETAVDFRLGRHWTVVLPGVYAAQTGPLTDRQRLQAALLFAGEGAMLDDTTALAQHGTPRLPALSPTSHYVTRMTGPFAPSSRRHCNAATSRSMSSCMNTTSAHPAADAGSRGSSKSCVMAFDPHRKATFAAW